MKTKMKELDQGSHCSHKPTKNFKEKKSLKEKNSSTS
jgi:hypothetical protein